MFGSRLLNEITLNIVLFSHGIWLMAALRFFSKLIRNLNFPFLVVSYVSPRYVLNMFLNLDFQLSLNVLTELSFLQSKKSINYNNMF